MKYFFLCKRYYTNKDLLEEHFGRLFHLPFQLSKLGNEVIVVAADYRNRVRTTRTFDNVTFISQPFSPYRALGFIKFVKQVTSEYSPSIVVASGDSHLGVIGLWISSLNRAPFIFDVYDDYSAFGSNSIPGMKAMYRFSLRRADLVIAASRPLAHKIEAFNSNLAIIPNGIDDSVFFPMNKQEARAQLDIPDKEIVIGYFGSISQVLGIAVLIQAVKVVQGEYPNLRLLLAGHRVDNADLEEPWIDYRGTVSQKTVARLINACDVVVIPYLRNKQVDVSNACKLAEYVACGVPVVTTRVSDYAALLGSADGAVCEPGDAKEMAKAITYQIKNRRTSTFVQDLSWQHLGKGLNERGLALLKATEF